MADLLITIVKEVANVKVFDGSFCIALCEILPEIAGKGKWKQKC